MKKVEYSFEKGLDIAPHGKYSEIEAAITAALGLKTRQAYLARKRGAVAHTVAEAAAIEDIFLTIGGVPREQVWGRSANKTSRR